MPAQKHIATWKLILAVCSAILLAYIAQGHGAFIIESAYAVDIQDTPGHPACSDHEGGLLSGIWKVACYLMMVGNLVLRIPIAIGASVLMLPLYLGTLIAKLPALIIYEVFMTIATIVMFICLWLVESSLSPAPGTIAHTFLYQTQMQDIIYSSLWVPVRDIANVGFALVILFGAITTILYANKEWLSTHAQKLFLMIILVNFSWFFSRVMLDIGNVAAKTAFSLAPIQNCVPNAQNDCKEIKDIVPNPWLTFAFDAVFAEPFVGPPAPANYTCPLLLICVRKGPPDNNPVDKITAGIMEGYVRILYVEGADALGRIRNFFGWANIQRFYTRIFTSDENVLTLVLRLAMDLITDVLMMNARVMTLMIVTILFLTAIVILFVIFLMRIPIIWLTQGFMPICTLIPFLPGKLQSMVKENLWDKFLVAVFLPAVVGLPLAAGFAILRAAQNLGVGAAFDVAARMPPAAQILFGNFVNSTSQLFFVILAIAILWLGVMFAVKSYQVIPELQSAVANKIGNAGQYGARAWGEFAAKRMPILPNMGAGTNFLNKIPGLKQLYDPSRNEGKGKLATLSRGLHTLAIGNGGGALKGWLAGLRPGTTPTGPGGAGGTPPPPKPTPGTGTTPATTPQVAASMRTLGTPAHTAKLRMEGWLQQIQNETDPGNLRTLFDSIRGKLQQQNLKVDTDEDLLGALGELNKNLLTPMKNYDPETVERKMGQATYRLSTEGRPTQAEQPPTAKVQPEIYGFADERPTTPTSEPGQIPSEKTATAEGKPAVVEEKKGIGEEVRKGAKEGVIEGMGGKVTEEKVVPTPAAAATGAEALAPAAEGVAGEGAGGKAEEPTWGQAWEGLKNTGIGTIIGGTRDMITGKQQKLTEEDLDPKNLSKLEGRTVDMNGEKYRVDEVSDDGKNVDLIDKNGNWRKFESNKLNGATLEPGLLGKILGGTGGLFKEAFRDKSKDVFDKDGNKVKEGTSAHLGSILTGLQEGGKELNAMARAGNAPLTQSASKALEEARNVRTVPTKHIDDAQSELKGNDLLNRQLGTHIDTFLKQSGANSADALLQIKNILNGILSRKGHGNPVDDTNLPSYLEHLLEKKKGAGEQGFGLGTTKDPRALFSQALAKVGEAAVYRSQNPKPSSGSGPTP